MLLRECCAQTNISSEGFRSLREGEAVEFEVEAGPDGRSKAVNVTGPGGAAPEVRAPVQTWVTNGFTFNLAPSEAAQLDGQFT